MRLPKKYFDSLFGIQKTLGNAMNNWKKQMDAVKDISVGFNAAVRGDADMTEKAEQAMNSLDAAIFGERMKHLQNLIGRLIKNKIKNKGGGFSWQTCRNINVLVVVAR